MRTALLACLVVVAACSGPAAIPPESSTGSTGATPKSSPAALSTGGIVEYTIPDPATMPADCGPPCRASVGDMTLGPDGKVWFLDGQRNQIGRVARDGSITQFPIPGPTGGSQTITAGPDGNVWFTARGTDKDQTDWIVRVTPQGTVTKFAAGSTPHTAPEGITAGPDGNLWFTEVFGNEVGRMSPSGTLTEFAIGGAYAPRGITVGPDGAIWFTSSAAVGRITVRGEVSVYPTGNDPSLPLRDIASGRDGNLWFSEYNGIQHISADGHKIVSILLPKNSAPDSLLSGPDGNIWFTDTGLNAIVRMNVAGTSHAFPMPSRNAFPHGIAVGADGRIWFGEGGRIASIGVRVPEATFSTRVLIYPDTSTQRVTVTNTGDANLAIGGVKVTGADQSAFAAVDDSCAGKSFAPGAKCEIAVSHISGGAAGVVQSALIELTDNATASPQRVSLVAQLRSCELPVIGSAPDQPAQGAMLDITSGRETNEQGGSFTTSASPARVNTVTVPVLMGVGAGYYDRPAGRWLPVPSGDWVSPDGSRYAYIPYGDPGTTRELRIVDVATGRERVLPLERGFWSMVGFTDRGVYVHEAYEGIGPGLVLVDPDSGSMRRVLDTGAVTLVRDTTAWFGDFNTADTLPQWGMGGGSNEVGSQDLVSGASRTWLYMPGTQMYVVATYNGDPVVSVYDQATGQFIVVTAPSQPIRVELPFTRDTTPSLSGFISDPQGLWIGSLDGLYLWTARTGGILVSTVVATPAGTCA